MSNADTFGMQEAAQASLEERLKMAEADAARWRWVRDHMVRSGWFYYEDERDPRGLWALLGIAGSSPVEAVDAAMRAEDKS